MLVVWRVAADAERLAGSLSAGEESLIGEFALEALSCAFRSSCESIAGLGDSLAWYNNLCCTRTRDDAIRALAFSALVEALARGAYALPSDVVDREEAPLYARPPASPLTLADLPASKLHARICAHAPAVAAAARTSIARLAVRVLVRGCPSRRSHRGAPPLSPLAVAGKSARALQLRRIRWPVDGHARRPLGCSQAAQAGRSPYAARHSIQRRIGAVSKHARNRRSVRARRVCP